MKFVCDNCQAKYQIGDEKVAGKTVRMKCRRCGYEIRVRAETTDASSMELPVHEPAREMDVDASIGPSSIGHAPMSPHLPGPGSSARAPIGTIGPRPTATPRPTMLGGHTAPAAALAAPLGAAAHAPQAQPSAPPRPLAPAPTAPASHTSARPLSAPRPVSGAPSAPRPIAAPRPLSGPAPAGETPKPSARPAPARPITRTPSTSSMAAVQQDEAHAGRAPRSAWEEQDESSGSEGDQSSLVSAVPESHERDWYVGIRGTPTGPIHTSEIRERARAGEVDGDSLVWREGMAEWRALRTVPALLAIVEAARAPIVITPAPVVAAPAVPAPAASVPFSLVQSRAQTPAPAAAAPATVANAPAPVAEAPATAANAPAHVAEAPATAASAPAHVADAPATAASAPAHVAEAPATAAKPAAAPRAPRAHADEPDLDAVLGHKRPTHPMAYAFIAAAAVFGGVAAWVLLSRPATQIVVVQAPPATAAPATPTATAEPDRAQVEVGEVSTGSPQAPGPKVAGQARPKSTATATAAPQSAPIDTSGFVNNVPGPSQNGPSGSQAGGGGQLSQGEISAVVSQNQPLVKRKCWQPALEARPVNGATNARVNGSITIGASGAVESASASGGERDFPGLASCIASRMKGWKFPPSGGSTTVNVPFVFAGQ